MKINRLHITLLTALIFSISIQMSYAANRTASVSGNWNSTVTWGGSAIPTSADAVTINAGITVTVNITNAQCASLTFAGVTTNSALTFSGTNSLSITGLLSMPRPSTSRNCTVNLNAGDLTCGSFTMLATSSGRNNIVNITTGTLTVSGTVTTGTTGCQINLDDAGTLNMGFLTGSPALSTVTGSSVNYTGSAAQIIYNVDYNGNLGLSGNGTKTMASSITTFGNLTVGSGTPMIINSTITAIVNGNINNTGTITLISGTTTSDTWLRMAGNVTNNPGGTIDATGDYTRFIFISANAQTFTNNGTVTAPVSAFGVANTNASGLTLAGSNNTVIARANLFYGTVTNAGKLTLGTGGISSAIVQRGMSGNTSSAGSLDAAPVFNVGTGGLSLYYDEASISYSTGFEIPASRIADNISLFNTADVTLGGNLVISNNLTFSGGTGTSSFRIGANTLTLNGNINYTADPLFYGGASSNLVLNFANTVKSINSGLNNFTVNANTNLLGAITVNGTLTLSSGALVNSTYLTMANGSTISRSLGSLGSAPIFSGNVNLIYTGSSPITTGMEMPISSGVLNNLTTNTGGVIQGGNLGSSVNILTDAFDNLNNWTGDLGASYNQYSAVSSSNAGGSSKECRYAYGSSSSTNYTTSMYRSVNTTGYTSLNISWKQFIDNYNATTWPFTIKVQCAASSSGPWTDIYSSSPTGTANIGPDNLSYTNWTTNVGGTFYIRYYITGYTYGLDFWYFDDLVIDGQSSNTPSTVTVNGDMNLSAGTYSISTNSLVLNGTLSGSSALVGGTASNLLVGGSGSNLVIPAITSGLNNFSINRATGVTLNGNATVYGILNLLSANASATQGALHTGVNTISMGASATTTGAGDVTGIVKRQHTFSGNIVYSFGNQNTTIVFTDFPGGVKPSWISCKIAIGSAPTWRGGAVKRTYSFAQDGTGTDRTITHLFYLDSELNGSETDETKLVFWDAYTGPTYGNVYPRGKSNNSTTENWVGLTGMAINFIATSSSLDVKQWGLGYTNVPKIIWTGNGSPSFAGDWSLPGNWNGGVPTSSDDVLIPATLPGDTHGYPTRNLNTSTVPATCKTLEIETGASVTVDNYDITITGSTGAWSNSGTFNPGTGIVNFIHGNINEIVTVSGLGANQFHNINIAANTFLKPGIGFYMKIDGWITPQLSSMVDLSTAGTSVEYNGANQTVINPDGNTPGYYHLILSGSGTKTMPGTALSVIGNLTLSGTSSASVNAVLTVGGNVTMGAGNTLNLGSFSNTFSGNVTNNGGTLTSSLSSITLNGNGPQSITSTVGVSFTNFTISNTTATVTLGTSTNCSISGGLNISTGAVFNLVGNNITAITGSVTSSGTVITQSTSVTPVPAGKTWGGSFVFSGTGAQTIVAGTYNNLTISGSGGATATANITVNGILNLTSVNPSETKGILDMGSNTVLMGSTSSTVGPGDVTGIVRRTTIVPDVTYSYGNQYTTINFENFGTLPSELSLKINIGIAPAWKSGAIKRVYELIQTGAVTTHALMYAHYLDSELNGNNEENLVDWIRIIPTSTTIEYGRSANNTVQNWVSISNANIGIFYSSFGIINITLDESETTALTWNGSTSNSWVTATNWTPNAAPSAHTAITIPDAATTTFDPTIPIIATCGTLKLESGAILNSANGAQLTINDGDGAWDNQAATFNAGNSTIVFTNSLATLTGSTDFYNLTLDFGASIVMSDGTYVGVSGNLTNNGSLRTVYKGITTVEYKGGNQTVVVPNTATNRYSNLILSGTGTKTMPVTGITITKNYTVSGSTTVNAGASITFLENMTIGNGSTFNAGNFAHSVSGNFTNNGIFSVVTGGTLTMNGGSTQGISGTSSTTFDNLTINNSFWVALATNITVNGSLTLTSGDLSTGTTTIAINGTIGKTTGFINAGTGSSIVFGGTTAVTLPDNLFSVIPFINNLSINNSAGVTLGNQDMTIMGLLNLIAGTLNLGANEFTLTGSSPIRTSGTIDASNTGATLTFNNSSAIFLPSGIFSTAVNDLDIDGAGGITASSDFTINGILDLDNNNPSATKGCLDMWDGFSMKTLTMGADATTVGIGEVTGMVRRTTIVANISYTFGSRYMTAFFPPDGTLPSEMSLRLSIGNAPSWRAGAIQREVELIQTGGSNTKAVFTMHYLDSELNGNIEDNLVLWVGLATNVEYGRSAYNTSENWVRLSNINVAFFSSSWDGTKDITLDEFGTTTTLTWNGSVSNSWTTIENWTPNEGPSSAKKIIIPDASATPNDPSLPSTTEIKSLTIQANGTLNSGADAQLTINGSNDAWNNAGGTFNASSSNVIFTNAAATLSGSTNFYNVTINTGSELFMTSGSVMRIGGAMTNNGKWHTGSEGQTLVDYNGANQTVVIPNTATNRYSSLTLSGSGTKTMPVSTLSITGDFEVAGTANVTALAVLLISGYFDIGSGSTFNTGSFNHTIGGNFSNLGSFNVTSGNTFTFNGTLPQTIDASSALTFDYLTIDNNSGVLLLSGALTTITSVLTINTGKRFEVSAGRQLTVTGTITNNAGAAGFVVKSDASGTASLIHTTDNVPATVELYISGADEDWHFLSSPVAGQSISGTWLPSGTYGNGTGYDLYLWNEPTNCWIYKLNTTSAVNWTTVHPGADFMVGRGYLYSTQAANPIKAFAGNLNNGTVNASLTISSTDAGLKGFNLVGNPYPSSIDWAASSGWSRTDLVSSGSGYDMWIWNPTAENYGVCNSYTGTGTNSVTQYIASMQGFFVRADIDGTLSMDNTVRVHNGAGNWFKKSISNTSVVSVVVQSEADNSADEVQLQFGYATNDIGAEKLFSHVKTAPSLYMTSDDEKYSVRYLTNTEDNPVVPVMFKSGQDGSYTLTCNFAFDKYNSVFLEDRQMNYLQNLKDKISYKFLSSASDDINRFVLHFGPDIAAKVNELPARIYTDGTQLNIDLTLVNNETTVLIYDALGRVLMKKELQGLTQHTLKLKSPPQILIVQLRNQIGSISRKVFYQNNY